MVPWTRALTECNAEIMRLRQELQLDADATPQEEFSQFLEASNQLSPRALRAAEREYRESEAQEEERDYLSFLKTSGQVPAEHPPQEDFNQFLEASNQLTPRALRAAEREYRRSEAQEEEEDFAQFLSETGQVSVSPSDVPLNKLPVTTDSASLALQQAIADISALKAELGIEDTPQEEFSQFLEASNQLSPSALRSAESEFRASEAQEEERDYLSFLKTSGQVPAEHPPQEDFNQFLEASNQLTPRALRAAEREFQASEAQEEEEDFAQFLSETGQIRFPSGAAAAAASDARAASIEDVLTGAEHDIMRLRRELGAYTVRVERERERERVVRLLGA